jgi:hypothetical protein
MPVAAKAPATAEYEALTNLSIGRVITGKDGERQADIVHRGEIVHLTEEQARGFTDPKRHRVAVIRPAAQQNDPAPDIRARDLFGARPQAQQFGARPDPAGASQVIEHPDDPADPLNAPEAKDPVVDLSVDPDAAGDK